MADQSSSRKSEANSDSPSFVSEPMLDNVDLHSSKINPVTLPTDSFREVLKPSTSIIVQPDGIVIAPDTPEAISDLDGLKIATNKSLSACSIVSELFVCPAGTFISQPSPIASSFIVPPSAGAKVRIPPPPTRENPLFGDTNTTPITVLILRQLQIIYLIFWLAYLTLPLRRRIYLGFLSWIDYLITDEFIEDVWNVVAVLEGYNAVWCIEDVMESIYAARVKMF